LGGLVVEVAPPLVMALAIVEIYIYIFFKRAHPMQELKALTDFVALSK
jgi:hypothetical protein